MWPLLLEEVFDVTSVPSRGKQKSTWRPQRGAWSHLPLLPKSLTSCFTSSLQATSREGTLLPSPPHDADTVWSHCTQPTCTIIIKQVMNGTIGWCVGVYLERRDQSVGTHLLSTAGVCQLSRSTFLRNRWHRVLPAIGNVSTLEHIATPAASQSVDDPPKPGNSTHLVKSVYALHCTTLHYTTLHYTALHCTTLHYTALHYTALHYTALHCTTLHYTAAA